MDKKNTMLLTVIAVATLLVAVVGATFAYFSVTGSNDEETTTVTVEAEDVGTVALTNPTSGLYLKVTAADMAKAKAPITYYATATVTDGDQPNWDAAPGTARTVAQADVTGGEADTKYTCTFSLDIEVSGTMAGVLTSGDAILTLSGATTQTLDLSTLSYTSDGADPAVYTASTSYDVTMSNLTGTNTSETVQALVSLTNRADTGSVDNGDFVTGNQNYLGGKSLTVKLSNSEFACDTVE